MASLALATAVTEETRYLTPSERQETIVWLLRNQDQAGGFCGRTGKDADACYCFWCGAALQVGPFGYSYWIFSEADVDPWSRRIGKLRRPR